MKKIKFSCSNCHAKLRVPTHLAGISAPCPKCGRKITAPTDLDSIVEDEPVSKPKRRVVRQENDAAPKSVPASVTSTAVADAPPRSTPPRQPVASAPAPPVTNLSPAPVKNEAPAAPPVPDAPAPPSAPVARVEPQVEEEPIVEETLLTPPPAPPVTVSEIQPPVSAPLDETQPIQVNPLPGTLPEVKHAPGSDGQTLPRLDAERGAVEPMSQPTSQQAPAAPTKLQLPQEADLNGQQSPGDFIVPATPEPAELVPEPAPVADERAFIPPPEPVIPDLSDLDMSGPGTPMEELGEPPAQIDEGALDLPDFPEPSVEAAQPTPPEEPAAPQFEAPAPAISETPEFPVPVEEPVHNPEPTPPLEPQAAPEAISPLIEEPGLMPSVEAEVAPVGLSEGSMERLLSEQTEPENTAPITPAPAVDEIAPRDELEELFETRPAAPAPRQTAPISDESQSLEEMFGEIPADPGKKKLTKVVMFSMIGAVVIISIVVVIIAGNAAGGFSTPQIASNQTQVTPPPRISEIPPTSMPAPEITDTPAIIDPVAQDRVEENAQGITRTSGNLQAESPTAPEIIDPAPPSSITPPSSADSTPAVDTPALSFDERVQQIVNGSSDSSSPMNVIGGETEKSPLDSLDDTIASLESGASSVVNEAADNVSNALSGGAAAPSSNYNPPAAFPAPGPDDAPLGRTHDLLDAFLRAPDWQSRIPYIYQGESLRPAIEEYYKKWPITSFERFSLSLFQMEQDATLGGPYWVYLVSTNDYDQGYPVIIRVEDGNLKVDWEIYSEFQDQHFVEFQKGAIASPHSFRLVIERVSDYFGSDRDGFTDLEDYLVYQINPPYGDLSEFSEYAFVRKDSAVADQLEEVVGLNDEPLAVIVTIEQKAFAHGVKHLEITDYVTEGWFR